MVAPPVVRAPVPTPELALESVWRDLQPGPHTIAADRAIAELLKKSDDFARKYGFPGRGDPTGGPARSLADGTQKIVRTFIDRGM